jgi:hypothetical protein
MPLSPSESGPYSGSIDLLHYRPATSGGVHHPLLRNLATPEAVRSLVASRPGTYCTWALRAAAAKN